MQPLAGLPDFFGGAVGNVDMAERCGAVPAQGHSQ
jgi:hypothetical protein